MGVHTSADARFARENGPAYGFNQNPNEAPFHCFWGTGTRNNRTERTWDFRDIGENNPEGCQDVRGCLKRVGEIENQKS